MNNRTKTHLIAIVLATALAASGGAWWAVSAWSNRYPHNFATVAPEEFYRSAQPAAAQLANLVDAYHIGAVISLRTEKEQANDPRMQEEAEFCRARGIEFRQLPTTTPPTPEQLRAFLAAASDPALPHPVLIHCAAGRVRTGACVALWRITRQGWTVEPALEEARRYGLKDPAVIAAVREFSAAAVTSGTR